MTRPEGSGPSRVLDLDAGVTMVVTDLHGAWDDYRRYRDHFLTLLAAGRADYLVFTGDLIHAEGPPAADRSLDILLDLLALRASLGWRLIYLLGNHELAHLYGIVLAKGDRLYTPRLEAALGAHRAAVLSLFDSLPFYVRTRAGVAVCHAGSAVCLAAPGAAARLFGFSHERLRRELEALLPPGRRPTMRQAFGRMHGASYEELARTYLAASGPDDPHYDDLLVGYLAPSHPDFVLLWDAFFNRNEAEYGALDYAIFVDALLQELSAGYHRQAVLVAGHMPCHGGYELVAGRQLRLASGAHAHPRAAGRCLLFDAAAPVAAPTALLGGLGTAAT